MTKSTTSSLLKKTAAGALALTLAAGGLTGAYADAKSDKHDKGHGPANKGGKADITIRLEFHDLDPKEWAWAYEHIVRLASKQVFNGYTDGTFKPNNKISRIEAIVAAVRLLGLKDEAEKAENMNADLNFRDFDQVRKKYPWAVGYLTVALENDLFSETETHVRAEAPADRLWASVLLVKAMKLEAEARTKMDANLPFKDERDIPAGSVGYVAVAVEKGLVTGYGDNTFRPNKPVTRAELAALLDRVDEQLPDEDQGAAPVVGTIQAVSGGNLTVVKPNGTLAALPLDSNVFIFRDGVKAPVSALQAGDEVLVRTYQGKVVFIEVTKLAETNVSFADTGKVSTFTLNAQGKLATISLVKEVGGTTQTVIYNVDANVTITGAAAILAPNQNVNVTGVNNLVKKIEILA